MQGLVELRLVGRPARVGATSRTASPPQPAVEGEGGHQRESRAAPSPGAEPRHTDVRSGVPTRGTSLGIRRPGDVVDLRPRGGPEPQVALRVVARRGDQPVGHVLGLDALGGHDAAQPVGQLDDGPHDGPVVLVAHQVRDEGPVDLDLGDVEGAQLGQAGEADPEVVDGHRDALGGQRVDDLAGDVAVEGQRGLGDLEVQAVGGAPGLPQDVADRVHELQRGQVAGRDVDRDGPVVAGGGPVGVVVQRPARAPTGSAARSARTARRPGGTRRAAAARARGAATGRAPRHRGDPAGAERRSWAGSAARARRARAPGAARAA